MAERPETASMITRVTRWLLGLQLVVIVAVSAAAIRIWQIGLVQSALAGIGFVLLLRMLITANNFRIARSYCEPAADVRSLAWHELLRQFFTEFRATMVSSSWALPFQSFARRPAADPAGLPVLLIHGYGCNSGYWYAMSRMLTQARITHHAIDLEPLFCGIDDYAATVYRAVESLCAETGQDKIVIVAHSMGGLVARAYLRAHGPARLAKIITLGTPHRGTGLANFGVGPNSQQMRWDGRNASDWLRQLEQGEDRNLRSLFVSIYSHHDNIIAPQTSSCLPGAVNIGFHGVGHVALAFEPAVQTRVLTEILDAGEALPQAARKAQPSP